MNPHQEYGVQYCNICGSEGEFVRPEREREGYLCANCSASSRLRAVMYVLGKCLDAGNLPVAAWKSNKRIRILESSGRSSYPMMLKDKFDYYNTEFNPDSDLVNKPFTRFADFQKLAYPDEQFDFVIATDVFEHIREDEKAFREIFRVLKRDGTFIMTVPYNHEWERTLIRVQTKGDADIFVLPPEYHGGGGQTLAYRTYGRDLLDRLHGHGFSVGYLDLEVGKHQITRQPVFIGVKAGYIDVGKFHVRGEDEGLHSPLKVSPLIPLRLFVTFKYNLLSVRHFASEFVRRLTDTFRKPSKSPRKKQ
ncbi:MAG: class I SAM-dependent methyltransferase [Bacteroidota bacterium]|jgi:SAM-dependent methyltransferase